MPAGGARADGPAAGEPGPIEGCTPGSASAGLADRLRTAYAAHLGAGGGDAGAPAPTIAGVTPVPESSPPWPYATWNIGGTNVMGVDNLTASALMDALYCGPSGQRLKDSRFTVFGWLDAGANLSSSHTRYDYATGSGGNAPAAYDVAPNRFALDQAVLVLDRTPDVVQRDHVDWGARLAVLYGTDYKFTFANGVFSNQYLDDGRRYGIDPVVYYVDVWVPRVAEGMNVRVGRYLSIPDVETQLSPYTLTQTRSLLYTYDPFTQQGALATVRLNRNWQVQGGVTVGSDVAPWVKSERHLTAQACAMWTSDSGSDGIYPCMNGLNDGNWRWDNVQHAVVTWYHRFNARWHVATEAYYVWQAHAPNLNNPGGQNLLAQAYPYARYGAPAGARCDAALAACYSYAWAAANFVNYQLGPHDTATLRSDFFDDARGQRTGFKTRYYEFTLSYTHWLGDVVQLRPEVRFDHALDVDAYDNPTAVAGAGRRSQLMLSGAVIVHF